MIPGANHISIMVLVVCTDDDDIRHTVSILISKCVSCMVIRVIMIILLVDGNGYSNMVIHNNVSVSVYAEIRFAQAGCCLQWFEAGARVAETCPQRALGLLGILWV